MLEEINKEDIEESNQEEKASDPMDQVRCHTSAYTSNRW